MDPVSIMFVGVGLALAGLALGSLTNLEKTGKAITALGVVVLIIPIFLIKKG